ncbi:glycine cleavage system aminomethyltransferase GcvT [Halovulum sp. GXIMD14793]
MAQKTPLHALHLSHGAKMVDFAGWEMPVTYPLGLMGEHKACRDGAALFDVSHMGQVELRGEAVAEALETLVPGGITSLKPGQARYTQLTAKDGGILDDLIISNAGDHLYVVVNASMADQDIAHMRANLADVALTVRDDLALIAVQGPEAVRIVGAHADVDDMTFMSTKAVAFMGATARISRLGYTGEDGFEISLPAADAARITEALLQDPALELAGLGARDSLRLEAGLCLYGNDIDRSTSPIEAALQWSVPKRRREEGGFPGADRIQKELADGPSRKLVGITPAGRAPARAGTEIHADGAQIGTVTSGGFGPSVDGPISMGYVASAHAAPGTAVTLMIRGKPHDATVTALPFHPHRYKR